MEADRTRRRRDRRRTLNRRGDTIVGGSMWNDTAFTRRVGIQYPIVQGPFGGGLSSARLVAAVSNSGGLGSFGAQGMAPERIAEVIGEIRTATDAPFAVNLWVSTQD